MRAGMTDLLYLASPEAAYKREFAARVVALPPGGVILDRTLFYAVGGGQPADHGTLSRADGARYKVVDVVHSGAHAFHRLERGRSAAPLQIGDEVRGEIDWERRYAHMRGHTGQHLLSARVFALTGRRTRRAVLGRGSARLELDGPWPESPSLAELASDMAGWVDRALPVTIRFVPRAEYDREPAPRSGLVPLAAHVDPVRLVEIERADRCPCGGTHLRNTAEIGGIDLAPPRRLPDGSDELSFTLRAVPATPSG
jgi:misacylated tRNA(Ala) deacylase